MSSAIPTVEFEDIRLVVGGIRGRVQTRTTGPKGCRTITLTIGKRWAKHLRRNLVRDGHGNKQTRLDVMFIKHIGKCIGKEGTTV